MTSHPHDTVGSQVMPAAVMSSALAARRKTLQRAPTMMCNGMPRRVWVHWVETGVGTTVRGAVAVTGARASSSVARAPMRGWS
jgi:hypothetical protein